MNHVGLEKVFNKALGAHPRLFRRTDLFVIKHDISQLRTLTLSRKYQINWPENIFTFVWSYWIHTQKRKRRERFTWETQIRRRRWHFLWERKSNIRYSENSRSIYTTSLKWLRYTHKNKEKFFESFLICAPPGGTIKDHSGQSRKWIRLIKYKLNIPMMPTMFRAVEVVTILVPTKSKIIYWREREEDLRRIYIVSAI